MIVDVIIPALNEEEAIAKVVGDIPKEIVRNIVVVDNGSTDKTAEAAREAGALVYAQNERGYGAACLKGIEVLSNFEPVPELVVRIHK